MTLETFEASQLRELIQGRRTYELCAVDLATIAVDTQYAGFEDPRSAALGKLDGMGTPPFDSGESACDRPDCEVLVKVSVFNDSFTTRGACQLVKWAQTNFCLKEEWDKLDNAEEESRNQITSSIVRACGITVSNESAASRCPQLSCEFIAGVSIDGNAGTVGECDQTKREVEIDPSLSEVSVAIKPTQQ